MRFTPAVTTARTGRRRRASRTAARIAGTIVNDITTPSQATTSWLVGLAAISASDSVVSDAENDGKIVRSTATESGATGSRPAAINRRVRRASRGVEGRVAGSVRAAVCAVTGHLRGSVRPAYRPPRA